MAYNLPGDSKMTLADAKVMINNYQNNLETGYTSSFLIDAAAIKTYLSNTTNAPAMLLLYFANNNAGDLDFIIAGIKDTGTELVHDFLDMSSALYAFGNCVSYPDCGTITDPNLDGPQVQSNPGNITAGDSKVLLPAAHIELVGYQTPARTNGFPESFLLNADALKALFAADATVNYLHIYLGFTAADDMTLIIVGVDNGGNHRYYQEGGKSYVFENCMPCPDCTITSYIGFSDKKQ